jgi:hypothetical protein
MLADDANRFMTVVLVAALPAIKLYQAESW